MAYAAVICLKKTIERLQKTSCMPILTSAFAIDVYDAVCFFKDVVERLDKFSSSREAVDALASQIREAAWKLEDVLDLYGLGLANREEVKMEIESFFDKVSIIVMECNRLVKVMAESRTDESSVSSESYHGGETLGTGSFSEAFCIVGMAGIGKTTYALKYFEDSIATGFYNVHAFVTVGQKPELREVLLDILSQIGCRDEQINVEKVEELGSRLYHNLSSNRFIIVLDDVWDAWFWEELSHFLPENNCGNLVLLTTKREVVAESTANSDKMPFLSREESWDLFCANAFQKGESCPRELEEVGKKIAEYCEGLPLAIITVAKLLGEAEKTVEYWLKVANEETSVFEEASEKMSPVLHRSYLYLPIHLKLCFIYLGVFPCKCTISSHKMMLLLEAEEFLEVPDPIWDIQHFAVHCLSEIKSENITMKGEATDFRLHFSYWCLCVKEAERNKLYKVLKTRADAFAEGIERERRLCIHNNVLLGIKDTRKSLSCVSTARSILCTGPYHRYPVPIFLDFKLLKVFDAEAIRFCEFPVQLRKLVQLRYLSLTCGQKLPVSISKLCNLQLLIVKEDLCIRDSHVPTYLPMEVWDMKQLKHLEVAGADLPEPDEDSALLEHLSFLIGVGGRTCTKRVLERIPNVRTLVIHVALSPCGISELIGGFDNFHYLHELRTVGCFVMNPYMSTPEVVQWPITVSSFSSRLHSIRLSGQGYPWTMLTNIAMLPCLEVLTVLNYGCCGSEWIVSKDNGFVKLKSLQIEDTDLEHWEVEEGAFPILENLTIKHCYKLKQLPKTLAYNSITEITLIDCNPAANVSAPGNPIHISFKY